MASMSSSPARTEGRDTDSISIDRSPLGAGYFSGDNDIHHSDESMEAKEQTTHISTEEIIRKLGHEQMEYIIGLMENNNGPLSKEIREMAKLVWKEAEQNDEEEKPDVRSDMNKESRTTNQPDKLLKEIRKTGDTNTKEKKVQTQKEKHRKKERETINWVITGTRTAAEYTEGDGTYHQLLGKIATEIKRTEEKKARWEEWSGEIEQLVISMKGDNIKEVTKSRVAVEDELKNKIKAEGEMNDEEWGKWTRDAIMGAINEVMGYVTKNHMETCPGRVKDIRMKNIMKAERKRETKEKENELREEMANINSKKTHRGYGYVERNTGHMMVMTIKEGKETSEDGKGHAGREERDGDMQKTHGHKERDVPNVLDQAEKQILEEWLMNEIWSSIQEYTKEQVERTEKAEKDTKKWQTNLRTVLEEGKTLRNMIADRDKIIAEYADGKSQEDEDADGDDHRKWEVCIPFRENGRCIEVGACPYNHETKGVKRCTNSDYETYGFCDQWFTCADRHPYDAVKYGPRHDALHKYLDVKSNERTQIN